MECIGKNTKKKKKILTFSEKYVKLLVWGGEVIRKTIMMEGYYESIHV